MNKILRSTVLRLVLGCLISLAVMLCSRLPTVALESGFSGQGTGTILDPYQIVNALQLDQVRNGMGAHYILMNDIDLTSYIASDYSGYSNEGWDPIGYNTSYYISHPFKGSFDGNGHTISGLSIDTTRENYVGLFGYVKQGTIRNLKLDVDIHAAAIASEQWWVVWLLKTIQVIL